MLVGLFFFFFFKQKTAYEMRISDWSSDVCSSDLDRIAPQAHAPIEAARARRDFAVEIGIVAAREVDFEHRRHLRPADPLEIGVEQVLHRFPRRLPAKDRLRVDARAQGRELRGATVHDSRLGGELREYRDAANAQTT